MCPPVIVENLSCKGHQAECSKGHWHIKKTVYSGLMADLITFNRTEQQASGKDQTICNNLTMSQSTQQGLGKSAKIYQAQNRNC